VKIVPPTDIGGLQADAYKAINPEKKMPAMVCPGGLALFESDTIARYLLSEYRNRGPSFQPENPRSNLICRVHDMYLTTIQACMYRPPPFGPFWTRKDALAEYRRQLEIIDDMVVDADPTASCSYMCGNEISLADATLFPSALFALHMLPKFDPPGYRLPPKLERWFNTVKEHDPVFRTVYDEIMGGLAAWEENNRWDGILGAGWRDVEPTTIFDKIIAREIPADIVREDDKILAFKDINPAGPAHVLIIPKDRNALTKLSKATNEHIEILGRLMVAAGEISKDESLGFRSGARIVVNDGSDGGQEVMHLHVHVIGGRVLSWPPG